MTTSITVRLSEDLHTKLLLFAEGRSQGETPDLSAIVREALEHYLTPSKRKTDRQKLSSADRISASSSKENMHQRKSRIRRA